MPTALMDLIAALQYSLERESFVFVAEDIQEILERPSYGLGYLPCRGS